MLWLWHRPTAIAPIRLLAWEPPCAAGAALEKAKTQKKKKKKGEKKGNRRKVLNINLNIKVMKTTETGSRKEGQWSENVGTMSTKIHPLRQIINSQHVTVKISHLEKKMILRNELKSYQRSQSNNYTRC